MLFSRTYRYNTKVGIEDIKRRLIGQHVKIHNLDFEIFEKDHMVKVIPHAEQIENIKTLPITHVEFKGQGSQTKMIISSKMRKIDKGGPLIIIWFTLFMLIAAVLLAYYAEGYINTAAILGGIAVLVFVVFWIRLETGYFDYVRKIRDYIKKHGTE